MTMTDDAFALLTLRMESDWLDTLNSMNRVADILYGDEGIRYIVARLKCKHEVHSSSEDGGWDEWPGEPRYLDLAWGLRSRILSHDCAAHEARLLRERSPF